MKKSFTIFAVFSCVIFLCPFFIHVEYEAQKQTGADSDLSKQLCRAVGMIKKICRKNPKGKISALLKNSNALQTNIDANCIIGIGKRLEKDPEIKQESEKIKEKLEKKQEIIKRCFVDQDPKGFSKFERLLRNTTIKHGGFKLLWGKKETYQGAAFVAAAKLLEEHREK